MITSTRGRGAASLVSAGTGGVRTGEANSGAVTLAAIPGSYQLLVNAEAHDSLGRQQTSLRVRGFDGESMSDIVLAVPWGDTAVSRKAMIGRISRTLEFAEGRVRSYAEIYGLTAGPDGLIHCHVAYQIAATRRPAEDARRDSLESQSTVAFDRIQRPTVDGQLREWHDFDVSTLSPGRYLLRLEARDSEGRRIGRSQIEFTIPGRP